MGWDCFSDRVFELRHTGYEERNKLMEVLKILTSRSYWDR